MKLINRLDSIAMPLVCLLLALGLVLLPVLFVQLLETYPSDGKTKEAPGDLPHFPLHYFLYQVQHPAAGDSTKPKPSLHETR